MRKVHRLMKDGAEFVFSMSHPIVTAWDGVYDRYTRTETGERLYANLRNSMDSRPVQSASVSKAVFERRYMK